MLNLRKPVHVTKKNIIGETENISYYGLNLSVEVHKKI